jgi:hypothetical protein
MLYAAYFSSDYCTRFDQGEQIAGTSDGNDDAASESGSAEGSTQAKYQPSNSACCLWSASENEYSATENELCSAIGHGTSKPADNTGNGCFAPGGKAASGTTTGLSGGGRFRHPAAAKGMYL